MALSAMASHYEVLGVSMDADTAIIHAAWRRRIAAVHPDRARNRADEAIRTERAARLNAAWSVLSDPARRAVYDLDLQPVAPAPDPIAPAAPVADNPYTRAYAAGRSAPAPRRGPAWPSASTFQFTGLAGFVAMGALLTTFAALPLAFPLALAAGTMGLLGLGAAGLRGIPATA